MTSVCLPPTDIPAAGKAAEEARVAHCLDQPRKPPSLRQEHSKFLFNTPTANNQHCSWAAGPGCCRVSHTPTKSQQTPCAPSPCSRGGLCLQQRSSPAPGLPAGLSALPSFPLGSEGSSNTRPRTGVLSDETTSGRGKKKQPRKQLPNNAAEPQSAISAEMLSQQRETQKAAAAPCSPLALTSQLAKVQGLPQLLQQVGSGRVLLVLLAVVVLLGHHGVVEPGRAQLAVPVRVPALVRRGHRGGTVRVRLLEGAQGRFCRREHSGGLAFHRRLLPPK